MAVCSKKTKSGQSLIEVIVAVGMMALLLVAILALVALAVKNSRLAKTKNQAVALAQEGVELMRTYRDYSWNSLSLSLNTNYDLPDNWTVEPGLSGTCPTNFPINSIFRRCVILTSPGLNIVKAVVTVFWQEGAKINQTVQTTELSKW